MKTAKTYTFTPSTTAKSSEVNQNFDDVFLCTNEILSILGNSILAQGIINAGCRVAQRLIPNISTTYQYGYVDRFAAKGAGTAVSAGTINASSTSPCSASGRAIKLAGVTITGTGIVYLRYRMHSSDALSFKNKATSFGVTVNHDIGSTKNYTIYIRKPNSADNYGATTDIANSGAIAVPTGTPTLIKFENINTGNIGDVSNGLEIEIKIECGAITTKNFEFGEFQFNAGATLLPFVPKSYADDLIACQRYLECVHWSLHQTCSSGSVYSLPHSFKTEKIRNALTGDCSFAVISSNIGSNIVLSTASTWGADVMITATATGTASCLGYTRVDVEIV